MPDLQHFNAKICLTTTAWLLHEQKMLLVHHKKLKVWLAPGGHIEENELPHQAAERECWEETGIKVQAFAHNMIPDIGNTEFVPHPFASNLHWVCRENYDVRHGKADPETVPVGWRQRKCEQHLSFLYFVKPIGSVKFTENTEETLGIGWFTLDEVLKLDTIDSVKNEAKFVVENY